MDDIPRTVFYLVAMVVSCIFHEQMHARSANWMGDPTGKALGRTSWNPAVHIDPFMTILLPVALLLTTRGRFVFGGAKPVPINPLNFKNPSLGLCVSAAFGPLANIALFALAFGLMAGLLAVAPQTVYQQERLTYNGLFLAVFMTLNLNLAAFNLLPLPGLDGSRILRFFLPRSGQAMLDALEPMAMFITMILVSFGAARILVPLALLFWNVVGQAFGVDVHNAMVKALYGH